MQIKQFEYVLKIAEEGSITHAAQRLFISQQAISESLRLLERELGFQIFHRSRKGVTPTTTGQEFLNDLNAIMPTIKKWQTYAQNEEDTIKISILVQHVLRFLLTDSDLVETLSNTTDASIQWKCLNGYQLIEAIKLESNAISIMLIDQDGEVYEQLMDLKQSDDYEISELMCIPMAVVMRADDPLAKKDEIALPDLENYYFVCHEANKNLSFLQEITKYVGSKIYQLPEVIDISFFTLQHPQTFSVIPAISLKSNIYFKEHQLILKPFKQTQNLYCFLIYNKSAPPVVKKIYTQILNYLTYRDVKFLKN